MTEPRTRVRDVTGSQHPSPADAIRLIDTELLAVERRDDGHVSVNEADLTAAHGAHGARLRAEEGARLAAERQNRDPVALRRYPGA